MKTTIIRDELVKSLIKKRIDDVVKDIPNSSFSQYEFVLLVVQLQKVVEEWYRGKNEK